MKKITKIKTKAIFLLLTLALPLVSRAQLTDMDELQKKTKLPPTELLKIIENVMMWLLGAVGIIAIIAFCISGILYMTSSGDQERVEKAKKSLTYSIIGVIVALGGLVVIKTVMMFLS